MRFFYSAIFYLIIPFVLFRLYWRGFTTPEHRRRWHERFAFYKQSYPQNVIWFHAVSVGEVEALFSLVNAIKIQHPDSPILITTMTPTGSARVKAVLGESVSHVYVPYDIPDAIGRFMRCFKPKIAVMMETEIWPNLFACCGKRNIPLYIVNARIAEKSLKNYKKLSTFIRPALNQVRLIATQTEDDKNHFIDIGAVPERVKNFGNIKFDVEIPEQMINQGLQLKADLFKNRFVWLIASTHKDEEQIFIDLYKTLKTQIPELLLVLVPRHQQRFAEVTNLCTQQLTTAIRTANSPVSPETDLYLVDTIGELKMFYATADIAFVGGSMVQAGGHNILEAAAVGVPVLFGAYMFNFKAIADSVLKHQAAIQCQTKDDVIEAVLTLYQQADYRAELITKGKTFIQNNQGTVTRICQLLEATL